MTSSTSVEVQGLTLSYDDEPVVRDVSFALPAGSLVGIVGPNGAGKSTLIKAIVGGKRPDRGSVKLFGGEAENRRDELTYVPQRGAVDWDFPITAHEVVWQGRYKSAGLLGRFKKRDRAAVAEAMEAVDITDLKELIRRRYRRCCRCRQRWPHVHRRPVGYCRPQMSTPWVRQR